MDVGIITEEKDWITSSLERELLKNNIKPLYIQPSKIASYTNSKTMFEYGNYKLLNLKCAFVRNLGDESKYHRFDILKFLEEYVPLINPLNSIEKAANKYITSMILDKNKLPNPKTMITEDIDKALMWSEKFGDCVVKPLFGNRGKGIIRLGKKPMLNKIEMLKKFKKQYGVFYVQEFIHNPDNVYSDIRVFVVGDEVICAMNRTSNNWVTNIYQDGIGTPCKVNKNIEKLAIKGLKSLGLIYGGVDLMNSKEGLKIIEINGTPSWETISKVNNINITEKIVNYMLEKYL